MGRTQEGEPDRGVSAALGTSHRDGLGGRARVGAGLAGVPDRPVILAAPVEVEDDDPAGDAAGELDDERAQEDAAEEAPAARKAERSSVPDELYMAKLRELVDKAGGVVPSIREVARRLSIGQDRARRLVVILEDGPDYSSSMEHKSGSRAKWVTVPGATTYMTDTSTGSA